MHQIVEEANLVPIDRGRNGYITHIPHNSNPEPQHKRVGGGGQGLKKEKRFPKGRIAQCRGVECEKVVNTITRNCLSCLLSELFVTHAAGAPWGVPPGMP